MGRGPNRHRCIGLRRRQKALASSRKTGMARCVCDSTCLRYGRKAMSRAHAGQAKSFMAGVAGHPTPQGACRPLGERFSVGWKAAGGRARRGKS